MGGKLGRKRFTRGPVQTPDAILETTASASSGAAKRIGSETRFKPARLARRETGNALAA